MSAIYVNKGFLLTLGYLRSNVDYHFGLEALPKPLTMSSFFGLYVLSLRYISEPQNFF